MRMKKSARPFYLLLGVLILATVIFLMVRNSDKLKQSQNTPVPTQTQPAATTEPTPEQTPPATETPAATETLAPTPEPTQQPGDSLVIRTDYENFKPNESGEIPVVMFHRFIEAFTPDYSDKEYTTTFDEFEALLETLYNEGYRLISMRNFIDCNISVPAGTKPMVFTFDDGTSGQFNLIRENGTLKVNPRSAVGIMMAFNEKHPDFGLKGIFYVNMDIGDNTFKGEGTLRERFEMMESLGLEIGTHTWGHVDYTAVATPEKIQESLGKNQEKAEEILPGLRFYSLALPYGSRPKSDGLRSYLQRGSYHGVEYYHESILAVGAAPSVPSISKEYNSQYVRRIRSQGKAPVDADLTWWLPRMTNERMFISDGDPTTIVVPSAREEKIDKEKLNGKELITY